MILSNEGIRIAIARGDLVIDPTPEEDQYTTSAVDLTLGTDFRRWDESRYSAPGVDINIDLSRQQFGRTAALFMSSIDLERDGSVILPPYRENQCHILAQTRERIGLNPQARLAARVAGRSSLARLGLAVHLTAPTIHAGFEGNITLEMINFGPFRLRLVPGRTRICQLIFERLESDPEGAIQTAFQGQMTPTGEGRKG